jgi:predicted secreted acid phosphatase
VFRWYLQSITGQSILKQEETNMYATYHLRANELNADVIQTLKNTFHQREIVILPKDEYDEWEKARHNAAFTAKLQSRIKELDEGQGIVKTMAELEAMANG